MKKKLQLPYKEGETYLCIADGPGIEKGKSYRIIRLCDDIRFGFVAGTGLGYYRLTTYFKQKKGNH